MQRERSQSLEKWNHKTQLCLLDRWCGAQKKMAQYLEKGPTKILVMTLAGKNTLIFLPDSTNEAF